MRRKIKMLKNVNDKELYFLMIKEYRNKEIKIRNLKYEMEVIERELDLLVEKII